MKTHTLQICLITNGSRKSPYFPRGILVLYFCRKKKKWVKFYYACQVSKMGNNMGMQDAEQLRIVYITEEDAELKEKLSINILG